jgi:hypothetical protein
VGLVRDDEKRVEALLGLSDDLTEPEARAIVKGLENSQRSAPKNMNEAAAKLRRPEAEAVVASVARMPLASISTCCPFLGLGCAWSHRARHRDILSRDTGAAKSIVLSG